MDPRDAFRLRAAEGYLELGMLSDAETELAAVGSGTCARAAALALRAELASRRQDWTAMRSAAEAWLTLRPQDAGALVSLAFATRRTTGLDAARAILREAETLHPGDILIRYNLACYACTAGDLDEARTRLDKVFAQESAYVRIAREDADLTVLKDWILAWSPSTSQTPDSKK